MTLVDGLLLSLSAALALAFGVAGHLPDLRLAPAALAAFKASGIVLLGAVALRRRAWLLAAGLLCGAMGDALLALGTQAMFVAGAGAFLVGHLFYIALFLRRGVGLRAALRDTARVTSALTLAVVAIIAARKLWPPESSLMPALTVYAVVLTVMVASSFTVTAAGRLATVGAVLFFVSDGFVSLDMFHRPANPLFQVAESFAGWMIYWAGQAAICVGGLALRRPVV